MSETKIDERGESGAVWTPEQIDRLLIAIGKDLIGDIEMLDLEDLTDEQVRAELEADGIDVDACLARFQERMRGVK